MRHFYKNVVSGLVFWLLFSQSLSLFNSIAGETSEAGTNEQEGSEGRDFNDFISLVKRDLLATDVETGRSSSGIFNTTLAFTIPLFSFTLPDKQAAGKDYSKQAALSLIGLGLVGGLAVIPYVYAASKGNTKNKTFS